MRIVDPLEVSNAIHSDKRRRRRVKIAATLLLMVFYLTMFGIVVGMISTAIGRAHAGEAPADKQMPWSKEPVYLVLVATTGSTVFPNYYLMPNRSYCGAVLRSMRISNPESDDNETTVVAFCSPRTEGKR